MRMLKIILSVCGDASSTILICSWGPTFFPWLLDDFYILILSTSASQLGLQLKFLSQIPKLAPFPSHIYSYKVNLKDSF